MKYSIGSIVKACAGRDMDSYFVVVKCDEKGYIYIADGKSRKLAKPKRKNPKHLQYTNTVIELDTVTDKQLKKLLKDYSLNIL